MSFDVEIQSFRHVQSDDIHRERRTGLKEDLIAQWCYSKDVVAGCNGIGQAVEYSDVRGSHRQPIENSDIWKFLQEQAKSVYFSIPQYITIHYRLLECAYPIISILLYTLVYPSISQ